VAERSACLAVRHSRVTEKAVHASGQVLRDTTGAELVGQPPECEDRDVTCGDDVCVVTRSPELDE
jgi:hypothetical protein